MTDRSVNLFFGALRLEHLVEGCGGAADLGRCEAGAGEFTLVNLPAGIHRVIAVGIQADGGRELSGPHTILVR